MLPTALLKVHIVPWSNLRLSPREMTQGRPFLTTDILPDKKVSQTVIRYQSRPSSEGTPGKLPLKTQQKGRPLYKLTLVTKALRSQCRGPGSIPGRGTRSHMLQLGAFTLHNIDQRSCGPKLRLGIANKSLFNKYFF